MMVVSCGEIYDWITNLGSTFGDFKYIASFSQDVREKVRIPSTVMNQYFILLKFKAISKRWNYWKKGDLL
jgi:hypothetical protein